jgi:hypothetical protein
MAIIMMSVVVGSAAPAPAQEQAGTVYVQGGAAFPHQSGVTGESGQTYLAAPGGTTTGWTLGAGAFAAPFISIEGELSSTGMMTAREPSRYDMTFNEERRDRFIGGNVRFHIASASRVHLEPLVGLTLIHHDGWSTTERVRFFPEQHVEVDPRIAHDLPESVALTAGADLNIGGRRFALLPSFRWITRLATSREGDFDITSNYPGGFPRYTISGGVSMRVGF